MKFTGSLLVEKDLFGSFRAMVRVTHFTPNLRFGAFYSSIHIRPPMSYSIWLKLIFSKFEIFFDFVYLFAVYKHQSV